ncbi:autophagy-related protein 22-like protein [Neohortaea acidophila]|uniref:Autophagy-related protein n=1 Tax=Neohortaea acidophila TaxID=245834 RepID=A0A6A6Q6B3_9PEZI|nr:autophagy-related protein 22-like protein [Neohortaea acidophila]KAF2487978.1 autophagy-related protein 22-like protein [Neohortaea acidophila]
MAAPNPGLAQVAADAEDPTRGAVEKQADGSIVEDVQPVAPDQFEEKFLTSKWEIWSYYAYYIGNNGLTLFNFGPTQAQNLLDLQAQAVGGENNQYLYFAGSSRTINSIILLCNGISFAIQIVIFLILGSYADFGTFRPNILIAVSLVAWGIGFGWLGVHTQDQWQTGLGLYIVGLIAYQLCLTYWTAAFPGLARNTPQLRDKAVQFENGDISREEYDFADSMKRNELSNVAFYTQSVGEIFILVVTVGILFAVHADRNAASNSWSLSVLIAFCTGVWLAVAIPWFIIEKRRPGQDPGMNIVLAGLWQLWRAFSQVWQLKQSLAYLIGYFLLGDSLNTTVTVIATLQNTIVSYSSLELTYLFIAGIFAQAVGIFAFWNVQKRFGLSTKTMFSAVAIGIVLLDGWGMIGNWTDKFGFHNKWEVWAYQIFYGLAVCPWYSYSQTMISEVTPRGKEFLFFSLFSIIGKTSSFIGPLVSSAIIDAAGYNAKFVNNRPFYFLFGLSLLSYLFLVFFVDVKKSRIEQGEFLERERIAKKKIAGGESSESAESVAWRQEEKF